MSASAGGHNADAERAYYALQARVYRLFAPFYDAVVLPLRGLRGAIAALVPEGARVLDVATGTGEQALAFAARGNAVVGLDLSDAMLGRARRKNRFAHAMFVHGDATALPFADASFDASSISFALHEMPAAVREATVRELARVTRPGGTVVVVDYGLPRGRVAASIVFAAVRTFERDVYAEFVRGDLRGLLAHAGLEIVTDEPVLRGIARIVVACAANGPADPRGGARQAARPSPPRSLVAARPRGPSGGRAPRSARPRGKPLAILGATAPRARAAAAA